MLKECLKNKGVCMTNIPKELGTNKPKLMEAPVVGVTMHGFVYLQNC